MFRHLRTKLTVLYAGLFAAILLLIAFVALAAVSDNAQRQVRSELATSSLVFERVWAQRAAQLENDGVLLSRDFGFRGAVATHDDPTIRSALENLKLRLGIDVAIMITPDGHVIAADGAATPMDAPTLSALQSYDTVAGVFTMGGAPYEAVSVPIDPGMTTGWVVFAARLDRRQMTALETMASIPLTASVAFQAAPGQWRDNSTPAGAAPDPRTSAYVAAALSHPNGTANLTGRTGPAMATVKPLHALVEGRPIVLLLQYPLAAAMAPYRLLLGLLIAIGSLGFSILLLGTWALAGTLTRPISSLEDAARRLQSGGSARVEVQTQDEIGRLAESFNTMASVIKARERELETALDQAESANRAKSSFLTNMSHEVRTPLNGVIGVAGVLSETRLEPEQQQMIGIIRNSAAVLQRVLDDVLDLAQVEAGRMQITEEDFDLGAAVNAFASGADAQCQAKGLGFTLTMDEAAKTAVTGDRVRLEQILGNLLSNALKFTETGGVSLGVVRIADASYRFEIRDTGIGFDAATAALLFETFQQADGSITRKFGGSGLGLSISRALARAMGGELTGAASPGQGASFVLILPLARGARTPASTAPEWAKSEPASAEAGLAEDAGVRVLVADDHETNRTVARLILDSAGVEVVCVEDGAKAVAAFAGGNFDVIFMDMQMPVMDGLTAIREIRAQERQAQRARTPIMMLSANAMPEHVAASREAGADGHVAKPITPARLIAATEEALALTANAAAREAAA